MAEKKGTKVSVNDMVIKALALALARTPGSNVTFTENSMLHHKHADISVAVAIPGGLITPVIRKADTLTLSGIANAMKDFAARAKDRKLKPEEYQGGTSAVSNLGMFGIKDFVAVINPPQSSIIAVGMAIRNVPWQRVTHVVRHSFNQSVKPSAGVDDPAPTEERRRAFARRGGSGSVPTVTGVEEVDDDQ